MPPENTRQAAVTSCQHQLSGTSNTYARSLDTRKRSDLLFTNQRSGAPLSSRIWGDSLKEMLVESGLATWSEDDSNNCRKIEVTSGKTLTWYSFRHSWITFALERGVPIATVCNNCDTSVQYVQEHYFHYDAKRATGALLTGRSRAPKGGINTEWMKDAYIND